MKFPNSNPFRRSLLAGAVAAGLALSMGQAAAQTGGNQGTKATSDVKQSSESKRAEKDARKNWEQSHRASKIIGSEVRTAQNEKVGKVKDLVLADPSSGTISHVIVSVGGVAGMGDKLFAVPFDQIQQATAGKDYLVLSASSDLSKGFDEKSFPTDLASQDHSASTRAAATPAPASSPAVTPSASSAAPPSTSASTSSSNTPSSSPSTSAAPTTSTPDTSAASSAPSTSLDMGSTPPATSSPPPN